MFWSNYHIVVGEKALLKAFYRIFRRVMITSLSYAENFSTRDVVNRQQRYVRQGYVVVLNLATNSNLSRKTGMSDKRGCFGLPRGADICEGELGVESNVGTIRKPSIG